MIRGVDHRHIVQMDRDIARNIIAIGKDTTIRPVENTFKKKNIKIEVLEIPTERGVDHRNIQKDARNQESHIKANSNFQKSNFRTVDDRNSDSGYLKSIS